MRVVGGKARRGTIGDSHEPGGVLGVAVCTQVQAGLEGCPLRARGHSTPLVLLPLLVLVLGALRGVPQWG